MPGFTPFTDNYRDLSDRDGYQFEFLCDICGSGYRSEFVRSNLGLAGNVLEGAGGLLGGFLGRASSVTDRARDITDRGARDEALKKAANEIMPLFNRCPRCNRWSTRRAGTRSAASAPPTLPSWPRNWRRRGPISRCSRCATR